MNKQFKRLEYHRRVISNYLFDEKTLEKFDNNKKVILPETFKNMLYYPYDTVYSDFKTGKHKKKDIFIKINDIVQGKVTDGYNKVYRAVHPAWFLLFYKEFIEQEYKYLPKYNLDNNSLDGLFEIEHNKFKVRDQYSQSFKVYYYLLNDIYTIKIFEKIDDGLIKKLYLDLVVEQYVEPTNISYGKYIDMCYVFDEQNKNTLSIEINENHHNKICDDLRKKQIFARSLNKVINYYIEDTFSSIKQELYKELAKCFYKINNKIGINLYMVKCKGFDITYSYSFTELVMKLRKNELGLKELTSIIKNNWQIKNIEKIICKMINNNVLNNKFFNNCNNPLDLIDDNKIVKDAKLNRAGLTKILMYPRKKELKNFKNNAWEAAADEYLYDTAESYGQFMEYYYDMMDDMLGNNSDEVNMLYSQYKNDIGFVAMMAALNNIGLYHFRDICKSISNLEHHILLPYIVKSNNDSIYLKDVARKFGINSDIYKDLLKQGEHKQIINDYRWLSDSEIMNLYNEYHVNDKNNDSGDDSESDEEEL